MGEFVERNVIRSYWMFTGTYDSFHLSLTLFLYNYERYNMARGDGHLDSFYPWSQVLVLLSWTRVSWFEKKNINQKIFNAKYHNHALHVCRMCEKKNNKAKQKKRKKEKKTVTLASFLDNFVLESHRWFESVMPEAAAFSNFLRHW